MPHKKKKKKHAKNKHHARKSKPRAAKRHRPAKAKHSKRKPPKGGLDLKRISKMWHAAGKPGTWLGYIKAHKSVKVGGAHHATHAPKHTHKARKSKRSAPSSTGGFPTL